MKIDGKEQYITSHIFQCYSCKFFVEVTCEEEVGKGDGTSTAYYDALKKIRDHINEEHGFNGGREWGENWYHLERWTDGKVREWHANGRVGMAREGY